MATRNYTQDKSQGVDAIDLVYWTPMANGDLGSPYQYNDVAFEKMIQVDGTFGSGGTLVFEGSIDGTNWTTLKDNTGTALSVTTLFIRNVFDAPLYFRPRVSGGDGTTSLRCILMLRKQFMRVF